VVDAVQARQIERCLGAKTALADDDDLLDLLGWTVHTITRVVEVNDAVSVLGERDKLIGDTTAKRLVINGYDNWVL